jgi:membrane-associated protease RseP (regulator of RpoE activity)
MSRYHGVNASLPYFIPLPLTHIGTMGAFIRMRERIPTRRALFDIGAAGPLAGLVATVVVTVVGLHLDPVTYSTATVSDPNTAYIRFNDPLLLHLLADLTGQPLSYADPRKVVNPVVFAGWVGCFVTLFNLLPAGQLDGGHVLRALLGERQETVAAAVPALLFGFAGYLYAFRAVGTAAVIWVVWGVITMVLAYLGPATPIRDRPLDPGRKVLAVATFLLGALCFMPVPFQVIS